MRIGYMVILLLTMGSNVLAQNRCEYQSPNYWANIDAYGSNITFVNGCAVEFDLVPQNNDLDCRPPIARYWEFGDGNSSTEMNPVHTYGVGGMKTVMLKQLYDDGFVTEQLFYFQVRGCGKDCYSRMFYSPYPLDPCLNVYEGAYDSENWDPDEGIERLSSAFFDRGDGTGYLFPSETLQTSSSPYPFMNYAYAQAGVYKVGLTIVTESGCIDTVQVERYFGCSFDSVTCSDALLTEDFESNGYCKYEPDRITYFDRGDCSFSFGKRFNHSGTDSNEDIWDFGDGTVIVGESPFHIYANPGTYMVRLTYGLSGGGFAQDSLELTVEGCEPTYHVDFRENEVGDCTFAFTPQSVTPNDSVKAYFWRFGDGNTSSQYEPTHQFLANGTYAVSLTMESATGYRDTVMHEIEVTGCEGTCTAKFSYETDSLDQKTFHFTSHAGTMVNQWTWDFGDGNTSNQANPTHTYANPGAYVVRSNVQGDGCEDIYVKIVFIATPLGEELLNGAINAFPNPSTGSFTVNAEFKKNISVELNVIDMNGRQAIPNIVMEPGFAFRKEVNISSLPAGVYLLQLQTKEGLLHRQRIYKY